VSKTKIQAACAPPTKNQQNNSFPTGNRTLVCRVTGGDTNHYTIGNTVVWNDARQQGNLQFKMNSKHMLAGGSLKSSVPILKTDAN
jgi:hypothetical protein